MLDFAFVRAGCLRREVNNTAAPPKSVMTVASSQLVKLHSVPRSRDRIAGYQIGSDQSANILGRLGADVRWGSTLGHGGDVRSMTALPPKAEVNLRSCYVAEVP